MSTSVRLAAFSTCATSGCTPSALCTQAEQHAQVFAPPFSRTRVVSVVPTPARIGHRSGVQQKFSPGEPSQTRLCTRPCATSDLPTPRGPENRYACEGRVARLGASGSNQLVGGRKNFSGHSFIRLLGIHYSNAIGFRFRGREKS